ncbi:MAG: PAS domain S-box protein [Longimicrobiales bacterium]|nr:PAS domain S-box protein [Longimicrobiales bacterium]
MDIRTKMVFTLVSVALGSMLALAALMYQNVSARFDQRRLEQLEGLAEFKVESLQSIVEGWYERMSLVASRNQLGATLASYEASPDSALVARLATLLDDVRTASPSFVQLWIYDRDAVVLASSGPYGEPSALDVSGREASDAPWFLATVFPEEEATALAELAVPLRLEGARVGYLRALLSTREIVELSREYEGLDETGETMVVTRTDGRVRLLHGARAAPPIGNPSVDLSRFRTAGFVVDDDGLAAHVLGPGGEALVRGAVDYRGEEVLAALDYLPETRWGVVVKIDAAEQALPARQFRQDVVRMAVVLAAFAILLGMILGFRVAQPIHLLSEASNRIRDGDLTARSGVEREDEVGLLGQTFDKMAAELERQVELLTEYRLFFDMSLDMMCIAATDGYFKRVNPSFTRELGWSQEELLARPIVSFVHPDDVDKTLRELEKLDEGIPTISFENRYLCKDGSYKVLRWRSTPERGTGRLYAIARAKVAEGSF